MEIRAQHKIDASEITKDGSYDYHYAYTDFTITECDVTACFRLYDGDSNVTLHTLLVEGVLRRVKWGPSYGSETVTFPEQSEALLAMLRYLQSHHGVRRVKAYDGDSGGFTAKPLDTILK